jgi:hypothetical protein
MVALQSRAVYLWRCTDHIVLAGVLLQNLYDILDGEVQQHNLSEIPNSSMMLCMPQSSSVLMRDDEATVIRALRTTASPRRICASTASCQQTRRV